VWALVLVQAPGILVLALEVITVAGMVAGAAGGALQCIVHRFVLHIIPGMGITDRGMEDRGMVVEIMSTLEVATKLILAVT
jgi:hypothetical protein